MCLKFSFVGPPHKFKRTTRYLSGGREEHSNEIFIYMILIPLDCSNSFYNSTTEGRNSHAN